MPLSADDTVDLVRPIQGGHVLFIGAFVRNVDSCGGSLRGELRRGDGASPGAILVFDERSSELQPATEKMGPAPAGMGWGQPVPNINEVPNVPTCPNVLADEFLDRPAWLQVIYTARDGQTAAGQVRVLPRCRQTDAAEQATCRCECTANYTIERCLNR